MSDLLGNLPPLPPDAMVLIIDDDPVSRDLMRRMLTLEGLRVATAPNGLEGLKLAREVKPLVIVLDVMMPGMDGWTVLTKLKSDPELAPIPVVMATMVDELGRGFALGASDYLMKPVDWDRMAVLLRSYASKRSVYPVLVVEDDVDVRRMMRRSLEDEGWSVLEAGNGREALQRVKERLPGLILLDLMMPEVDGFEFLSLLRLTDQGKAIPVVILTAMDLTAEDRKRLTGAVEHIIGKGAYTRDELIKEIRGLVSSSVHGAEADTSAPAPDATASAAPVQTPEPPAPASAEQTPASAPQRPAPAPQGPEAA